jgi:hypothetical protein
MEGLHVINRSEDRIKQLRASPECRIKPVISSGDQAEEDKKKFWEIYDIIWKDIYQTSPDITDDDKIKLDSLVERLTESYKLLILNAIVEEKKAGKKAYLRISPIGDGAWANRKQNEIQEACGIAIARIIKSLDQEQIGAIGAIEFAQFQDNTVLLSFLKEAGSYFPNKPSQNFLKTPQDQIDGSQIQLAQIILHSTIGAEDKVQIPIVNFCHNGDVNRKIPFQQLQTSCPEQFSTTPTDDDLTAYIICPWDAGCRGIGNEYHTYRPDFFPSNSQDLINHRGETLQKSMDPVMACASPILLLTTNPEINKELANNLYVINEEGQKLAFDEFGLNHQLKEHLKNLGYINGTREGVYSGNDSLELDLKNNKLIFPATDKDLLLSFGIASGAIKVISAPADDSGGGLSHGDSQPQPKISIAINPENIAKLPRFEELTKISELLKPLDGDQDESKPETNKEEARASKILEYNPIIPKLSELLKLQTTTPSTSPQEPQAQILNFSNVWDNTNRANKYKIQNTSFLYLDAIFDDENVINLEKTNSLKNELFKYLFCKAFNEFNSQEQSFTFQDAIDALLIAKTFGGLSNIKKDDDESYSQILPTEFIAKIKEKFPREERIEKLDKEKLQKFQEFSGQYQNITKHFFTSGRPLSTTGLRLTFFPDQLIGELVKLNPQQVKENEISSNTMKFVGQKLGGNSQ